jgi:uncharacterized membrane-anchored protein YhcB (DUF1043 family)
MDSIKSIIAELTGPAEPAKSGLALPDNQMQDASADKFNVAFKDSFDRMMAARSGNPSPESGMVQPARAEDIADLEIRTLEGGTRLLLGGKEPSEEVVMAFARAQGFDTEAMATLVQNRLAQAQNDKWSPGRSILPTVKLDSINLQDALPKLSALEIRMTPVSAPPATAAPTSAAVSTLAAEATTAQNPVAELRADLTEKSSVEIRTAPAERTDTDAWRKHDQHMEMSRRLTEALGQRLSAQIARGAWRVEMDIHPKSLGRIEIQLEMKNGELEAHFNASKQLTRDLLQDSLPRLRQALDQHGIDSAYIGLGAGQQQNSDGKPTAEQRPQRFNQQASAKIEDSGSSLRRQVSSNGLDIEV